MLAQDWAEPEAVRQLKLALAAATVAARRSIAARRRTIAQSQRESRDTARAVNARIDGERRLATERLRPVFNPQWWETAGPQDIADMWREANSWRDAEWAVSTPTIFEHAVRRIHQEVRDRSGLDPRKVLFLAQIHGFQREQQSASGQPGAHAGAPAIAPDGLGPRGFGLGPCGFDAPWRREQLRIRLAAAGVPEAAIEARTLADLGHAREAAEAVDPVGSGEVQ
jgi:hypothetical protein